MAQPYLLFLDHWVIIRLFEDPSAANEKTRLSSLCKKGSCVLVLTIWHIHEMLRDKNTERAKNLCVQLDSLTKEIPCLWIRLRLTIQEDELAVEFFNSQNVSYARQEPLCEEPLALFPNSEKAPWIEEARKQGLRWFLDKPRLFSEALREQINYPKTKSELKSALQTTVGAEAILREAKRQYLMGLMPRHYPSGLVIADETKRQFLIEIEIEQLPSAYAESLLSDITNKDATTPPTEEDLVDLQNMVSVLPYVDVAVLDAKFCNYVTTIKKRWRSSHGLAEHFNNVKDALDWIEKCPQQGSRNVQA